jgi:hypothetical protein
MTGVRLLLKKGAEVEAADIYGETAPYIAAKNVYKAVVWCCWLVRHQYEGSWGTDCTA